MYERLRTVAAGIGLGLVATSCSLLPQSEAPSAIETPTIARPSVSPSSSLPPRGTPKKRFKPSILAPGMVQGAQAVFNYPGVTPEQVESMEYCGNNTDRVLLTFDDAGKPEHILAIAKVLSDRRVGAIFFPNSGKVSQPVIDDLRADGFWVGNHTATHPNLLPMSNDTMKTTIKSGGHANLFRPPYGGTYSEDGIIYFDGRVKTNTEAVGKRVCLWTDDTKDWSGISANKIQSRAYNNLAKGSVILMHVHDKDHTLEALPGLIDGIKQRSYGLCILPSQPTTRDIPADLPCNG